MYTCAFCDFLDAKGGFAHITSKNRVSAQDGQARETRASLRPGRRIGCTRKIRLAQQYCSSIVMQTFASFRNEVKDMTMEKALQQHRLGWIGTGRMGDARTPRLLCARRQLTIYT